MGNRYGLDPFDFSGLNTISLQERGGKVSVQNFSAAYQAGSGMAGFVDSLPHILAGNSFRSVLAALRHAREHSKPILWGLGGHVIKCGLAPVLLQLMRNGFATAFAMNGSASIHDFEISLAGSTSESVEAVLPDGRFGCAEETGRYWNGALSAGSGLGESLGEALDRLAAPQFALQSLLLQAWKERVPVTVHVAIGTDTPHLHPAVNAAVLGEATHLDFRLFTTLVSQLDDGGVYLNIGSAVVMPEVFLKALTGARNLGCTIENFTTVNCDFLQHYRTQVNVIERPHLRAGGLGYALNGHHEIIIPLLAACLQG